MTESTLVWAWMGLAVATFVVLLFRVAPYGRHLSTGWGPTIGHRMGWIIMECVSPLALLVAAGGRIQETAHVLLVGLWIVHYLHRAIIYPFRARWKHRQNADHNHAFGRCVQYDKRRAERMGDESRASRWVLESSYDLDWVSAVCGRRYRERLGRPNLVFLAEGK